MRRTGTERGKKGRNILFADKKVDQTLSGVETNVLFPATRKFYVSIVLYTFRIGSVLQN